MSKFTTPYSRAWEAFTKTGEFETSDLEADAKFIAHAINGYLLEYYPHVPSLEERKKLVGQMYSCILKALEKKTE